MIVSKTQPFCRCCGKPLKKSTDLHQFGVAADRHRSPWEPIAHPEPASTRAEAQRYINQQIVSSKKDYQGQLIVAVWDGVSYRSEEEFFCTLRCAARYGRFAVIHVPDLRTQRFADAEGRP